METPGATLTSSGQHTFTKVSVNNLDYIYYPKYIGQEHGDELYVELSSIQYNSDEESKIKLFGKFINIPRKQVAFGDEGVSYKFSGNQVVAKPWPDFLKELRDDVMMTLVDIGIVEDPKTDFINYALVNLYQTGENYIGPHSDDESDLKKINKSGEIVVVSLSFGASRKFVFHNKADTHQKCELVLEHGDMLIMTGKTQQYWKHSLPKTKKVHEPRINVTFRFMKV